MGLLMGSPVLNNCLAKLAASIHKCCPKEVRPPLLPNDPFPGRQIPHLDRSIAKYHSNLETIENLCITDFVRKFLNRKKPCIIKNLAGLWPAITKWHDPFYFCSNFGHRIVPVEIGSRYTDSDWSQRLMPFKDFFYEYIFDSNVDKKGYLAQHQLLNQIEELRNDILIPDYCFAKESNMDGDENRIDINTWFGAQSVSPLHQDPKDNILVQICGRKYVHLIDSCESELVYPYTDAILSNTSQIDLQNVDLERFPKFKQCRSGTFGILEPGDALFIPEKWWHYVASLSSWSCSVSYWF